QPSPIWTRRWNRPQPPSDGDRDDVMKYRHVVVRQFGGPEVLQVVEDDLAAPRSGQALVKVLAADVGFSDVNIRRGPYPRGPRPPFTPGSAMVGVVNQLGPGTAGLETGQRVAAGKTATITVGYGTCQITVEPGVTITAAQTTSC